MISEQKKNEIVSAIVAERSLLGSMNKVANKLGINAGTISHNLMKSENWHNVSEKMWTGIAADLGISLVNRGWNIAQTNNLKIMHRTLADAQREALFMAVSEKAGSGKTSSIADFVAKDQNSSVYSLQCEEWSRKGFLIRLAKEVGVEAGKYDSAEDITEGIVRFFKQRAKDCSPLLILDEADKLKPAAKRFLIPLYNRLEDEIGLVCCGTENLEKEIKNGVRKAEKGYDEIDSRLGRNFVHLVGSLRSDVELICQANGITERDTVDRIFTKCKPITKSINGKFVECVEDVRAVKRAIKAEKLRLANAA
ncbi:ATP-binding protein [Dyadobacter frigoris]|uniref:ATP-binding protein n=1 Tax=Dyadobacter frigoris TaxID=2576211 RepID=A0A4U6D616_9BACT|nr:ATP-binding protein [Dyadobacter frigoris]TKT89504.1 ATP-binding protein [Dyadobacter frigoris]